MKTIFCIILVLAMVFCFSGQPSYACSPGGGSGNGDSGSGGSEGDGDSGSGDSGGGDSGSGDDGSGGDSSGGSSGSSGSGGSSAGGAGSGADVGDGADWAYRVGNDFDEPGKDFGDSLAEHEPDWLIFKWLGLSDRCNNETGENCDWTLYQKNKKYHPDKKE